MNLDHRFIVAVSVLVPMVVAGCSVASEPSMSSGSEDETESTEGRINASCKYPRRYIAVVAEGECTEVTATRGRWLPSPLFEDAPEGSGSCIYTWEGERYARVDRAALATRVRPNYSGALTPLCGSAEDILRGAAVEEVPLPIVTGQAGAVGCDVCGILKDGKIWVVLPPENIHYRQFSVKLSSGAERSFKLATDESARAVSVMLPPPPAGTGYVDGRVTIY